MPHVTARLSGSSKLGAAAATPPVQLRSVRTLWLPAAEGENYLLLEDEDTGDVLLPLIYMKSVFEANYSRKLSSLKHRLVVLPSDKVLNAHSGTKRVGGPDDTWLESKRSGFLYWQWAFESPHEVKVLVRQALGEENTPQGHLRLILLPIVYNAMAQKQKLRATPFFRALHQALRASNYFSLLKLPPNVEAELAEADKGQLTLSIGTENGYSSKAKVFNGPYDLRKTIQKYTLCYEAAEDTDISKRARNNLNARNEMAQNAASSPSMSPPHAGSPSSPGTPLPIGSLPTTPPIPHVSAGVPLSVVTQQGDAYEEVAALRRQTEEISADVKRLRNDCEANMSSIYLELLNMRRWMMEVAQKVIARPLQGAC